MPPPFFKFLATPLPALVVGEENLVIGFGPPPTLEVLPPSLFVNACICKMQVLVEFGTSEGLKIVFF